MTDPARHRLEHAADGVRTVESIHGGRGPIRVRPLFSGLTASRVNLHIWELPPGSSEGAHTNRSDAVDDAFEEIYYVLDGAGTMRVDGVDVSLRQDDAILVPVDVDHELIAAGDVPLRVAVIFALARDMPFRQL
jgi:mannose-6-phosphate isomerase-like protein (cupin superfamily)